MVCGMVHGIWLMGYGVRFMVYSLLIRVFWVVVPAREEQRLRGNGRGMRGEGFRCRVLVRGSCSGLGFMAYGLWFMVHGLWYMVYGS
ncbi:hypothetical protein T484DRAFT_3088283 [Baffinella frigidus]|nr:hypothetical protein T484DRAFT_3088283 [Cryptophyta sp. CCMP2293]